MKRITNQSHRHLYFAHGLAIESELPLPELSPGSQGGDLTVRLGKVGPPPVSAGTWRAVCGSAQELTVFWSGVAGVSIRGGREIVVEPVAGVDDRTLRLIILGPSLGIALVQRGLPVFHASCVSSPAGAAAFLGPKGSGKSTMAAALHRRGYDLVTDDVLSMDEAACSLLVRPSFPQTKLWPDSVEAIGEVIESLPLLHPDYEKRARRVSQSYAQGPVPLRCLLLLDAGQDVEVAPLGPTEALLGVMPHWYGAQFNWDLLRILGIGAQLRAAANLVKNVPTYCLKRPFSLSRLPEVTERVESHIAAITSRPAVVR